MSDESVALNLLAGVEFNDARQYALFDQLIRDLYALDRQVNPPDSRVRGFTGQIAIVGTVIGFTATPSSNSLRLSWSILTGAVSYEIRYASGSVTLTAWDTANSLLRTSSIFADIDPVGIPLTTGQHTFLIKAIDANGNLSADAAITVVNIPQITAPSLSATVIDNFVLLRWTTPISTFRISYYNVYKDGTIIGTMDGTFEAIFETVAGTFAYKVEAIDFVGNVGLSTTLSATVNQPPDYELQDQRTSSLNGTRNMVAYEIVSTLPRLLACVDTCGL